MMAIMNFRIKMSKQTFQNPSSKYLYLSIYNRLTIKKIKSRIFSKI